jgi:succinate dehydrogenase / fumarate reductase flavoprotein subunit/L-aspartate oxidase
VNAGVPFDVAWQRYLARSGPEVVPAPIADPSALLRAHHPDHDDDLHTTLVVGPDAGTRCSRPLADLLQANALIDEIDIAGAPERTVDVLVIGGGGAGAAAALAAAAAGARVLVVTKLRFGVSNSVMAEGGMQAAIGTDDSIDRHAEDTLRAGHGVGDPDLVARMVADGPDIVRWLIRLGCHFDRTGTAPLDDLVLKRPGGASADRIVSARDHIGLEIMRVLRAAVDNEPRIEVLPAGPVVELLSDERGRCAGAVLYHIPYRRFVRVHSRAVVLATGGAGRLHLGGGPTSNHIGATADGLVLAYRLGAHLRDVDSFQYHPTGLAAPRHLVGLLVSEAARSHGAHLRNADGERFVDELQPRDVVAAAVLREIAAGRGIDRDGLVGVWLDTPGLERAKPGTLAGFPSLRHLAERCGHDPAVQPFLVRPTLHYQNGGIRIDGEGRTDVPGLFAAGEVTGGIHGRNRLMGNALLDILSFGRRTGATAAGNHPDPPSRRHTLAHLADWRRALIHAGLPLERRAPLLFPGYTNFDLPSHASEGGRPTS